ncbi:Rz-like lysis system protein LysB [Paraburkholderia fungorum]|uniref:Rz-like lysis system protein LysB n=1 Tax=Paraburkholderia fungorum TaxID=134537 RepID=UPI003877F8A0
MNAIAAKLIAGAIALLLLVAAVLYVRELRAELADTAHQLDTAKQGNADRDETIRLMRQNADAKARQQAKLDKSTGDVSAKLAAAKQQIRNLIYENALVLAWANTALPADIARLSANPAYTGATAYSSSMPDGDALHAAGDVAAH